MRDFKDVGKILECLEDSRMFREYQNVVKVIGPGYSSWVHRPAAPASPRNVLEMQNPGPMPHLLNQNQHFSIIPG